MIITRRRALEVGAGFAAALLLTRSAALAAEPIDIVMRGTGDGSHVWFDPVGLHVQPGQTVRWTNRDPGNSHTVTAYHPGLFDRPRRIPEAATPWDSDYLLPDESFSLTLDVEGVYDYYCMPHEHAGMVGRIVVGSPPATEPDYPVGAGLTPLPDVAVKNLPPVADILARAWFGGSKPEEVPCNLQCCGHGPKRKSRAKNNSSTWRAWAARAPSGR